MTTKWGLAERPTEVAGPSPAEVKLRWALYYEAIDQARAFEGEAERCRLEAENAYADGAAMKTEGRRRAQGEAARMLPSHQRAVDVRTNTFKAVGDAKGDVAFYMGLATMYAELATMKYVKAQAIRPVKS